MPDEAPQSSLILYQTEDGRTRIQCRFEDETIWLTQAQMAELFQTTAQNVTLHLKAIFAEGELPETATCKDFLQVRREGLRDVARSLRHYRLEAILAVGYRVRSPRGTQFRQWATARLSEYLVKGFTMDDERLKNPPGPGYTDYFDELLERIRDIRASERRVYLRVREILALAANYSPSDPETRIFFQTVQSKLHFAVTGKTASELIAERAGKAGARLNSQEARRRADELQSRLEKRFPELDREAQISALPPVVLGGLMVAPLGLIAEMTGQPGKAAVPVDRQAIARRARAIVMEIERSLVFESTDREEEKLGYDIESRRG